MWIDDCQHYTAWKIVCSLRNLGGLCSPLEFVSDPSSLGGERHWVSSCVVDGRTCGRDRKATAAHRRVTGMRAQCVSEPPSGAHVPVALARRSLQEKRRALQRHAERAEPRPPGAATRGVHVGRGMPQRRALCGGVVGRRGLAPRIGVSGRKLQERAAQGQQLLRSRGGVWKGLTCNARIMRARRLGSKCGLSDGRLGAPPPCRLKFG